MSTKKEMLHAQERDYKGPRVIASVESGLSAGPGTLCKVSFHALEKNHWITSSDSAVNCPACLALLAAAPSSAEKLCAICDQPAAKEVIPGRYWCAGCLAMPEDERRRAGLRRMMHAEQLNNPLPFWHYLSFVGDKGFLGVCWVEARGMLEALQVARMHGCNPGGEVRCLPLPEHGDPPNGTPYVLHTDKTEIERLCGLWTARIN